MRWLISAYRRVRGLIRAEKIHREIDEEMRFHIDMRTAENISRGMSPEEARLDAERRFGNLTRVKERGYDVRSGRWLETLWLDLRYGARMLVKKPGFTALAILALALGIGANTAVFSVINALLLRPFPYADANRLVMVWDSNQEIGVDFVEASYPNFADWKSQNSVFEGMGYYMNWMIDLGLREVERTPVVGVSHDLFSLLGTQPALGRAFLPEDGTPSGAPAVVISHGFWQQHLGADPKVIGKPVKVGNATVTIVGVMPPDFEFPLRYRNSRWQQPKVDMWIVIQGDLSKLERGNHILNVIARLKPGVTREQAQAEMNVIAARLAKEYSNNASGWEVKVIPFRQQYAGEMQPILMLLFGAVGCVLLIACANVANLSLARASARRREIAMRSALGANRGSLIRQLLIESLLLSLIGGTVGLLLAMWGVELFSAFANDSRINEIQVDIHVLGFTFGLSVLTGLVFGLIPALQASKVDLIETLKEGGQGGDSPKQLLRGALVVAEFALAIVLLIGTGLFIRSFIALTSVDPGFNPKNVLTMMITLGGENYVNYQQKSAFFQRVFQRLQTLPGIESAGGVHVLPLEGGGHANSFGIEGRRFAPEENTSTEYRVVTPAYFHTMQIPLKAGRGFSDSDALDAPGVAIVNEAFVEQWFNGENPLGKRVFIDTQVENAIHSGRANPREIVGVVGNVRDFGLDIKPRPEMYIPHLQHPFGGMAIVVRSNLDQASLVAEIRGAIKEIDKSQIVYDVKPLRQYVSNSVSQRRLMLVMSSLFAGLALLLAVTGIYGVMSYTVTQSRREMGLRMALGAQPRDILILVTGHGMALAVAGVALGLAGAVAFTRVLKTHLYSISPTDLMTFAVTTILLMVTGLAACLIPARKATKVDPLDVLRSE
jgi:predicted permease